MNSKTMEGLVGASTSTNLMNTPMSVFHEASRKGDTGAMERALGYAGELAGQAEEYKAKADRGMAEDAREAKEKEKLEREKVIQKCREEREKLEERIEGDRDGNGNKDTVELSEEGKAVLKDMDLEVAGAGEIKADTANVKEAITYTKTGEAVYGEPKGEKVNILDSLFQLR